MGWLSKLLGGGSEQTVREPEVPTAHMAIVADLLKASLKNREVGRALIAYVLYGTDEVGAQAAARQSDGAFSHTVLSGQSSSKSEDVAGRNRWLFRRAGEDIELTLRYVRALYWSALNLLANNERSLKGQSETVKLIHFALQNSYVTDGKIPDEAIPPQGMNRQTALRLVDALGGSEEDLLRALVISTNMFVEPTNPAPPVKRLAAAIDFARDIRERPEDICRLVTELVVSKSVFLETIVRLKLFDHPVYGAFFADGLCSPDKKVRKGTKEMLARFPVEIRERLVIERFGHSDASVREDLADWLAGLGSPAAEAALQARLAVEKAGSVRRVIEAYFAGKAMQAPDAEPDDDSGYTAIGGERIAIPPVIDFIPGTRPVFGKVERDELVALIEADNAKRQARYEDLLTKPLGWKPRPPTALGPEYAEDLIGRLNGKPRDKALQYSSDFFRLMREAALKWYRRQLFRLPQEIGLREFGGSSLQYLSSSSDGAEGSMVQAYLQAPNMDLRRIDQLLQEGSPYWSDSKKGQLLATLIGSGDRFHRHNRSDRSREFARDAAWPMVAANLHVIDDAFSTAPKAFRNLALGNAIIWLGLLPATPQRFLAPLLAIATSPKRESRSEARALLADAPGIDEHLIGLLADSKADTRRVAAEWLGERRAAGAEAALRARLKVEKTEAVRAAMITALSRSGADISAYAGPAALLAEAEAGMKGGASPPPDWLGLDTRGFRWRDGSKIPDVVLHWWIKLAIKLKQPGGNGMFALYLDQLFPEDGFALSKLIFDGWIAKSYGSEGAETKGLLAFARLVPSAYAAGVTRWYLKTHGPLTSQTSALLELLAAKADPPSLQVVLSAANRLKQKGVQKLAGDLVTRIAEDNDWTLDQLADRSVPSLGMDETGRLELPIGTDGKVYVARLNDSLELVLFNPEGNPVKALPAGEDEASVDSKANLADAKKTLVQVVAIQRERLFDAMCSDRIWPAKEWLDDIHGHPVLRKASEQLVWQGLDAEGNILATFRPTPEGEFIEADDKVAELGAFDAIRLAHSMLVDAAADKAWQAHLKDNEVKVLFAQFDRATPGALAEDAESIADRNGWVTDTFTVRGLAKKQGYDRGAAQDGGYFSHYQRRFPVAGLLALINFSGNGLPEENVTAVIYDLRFARDRDGAPGGEVAPAKVPRVLLAECWRDYHAVAAKGAFDPDWERLSPW